MCAPWTLVTEYVIVDTQETKQQEVSFRFSSASSANGADKADLWGKWLQLKCVQMHLQQDLF